ncbi:hypothetical protein COU19_02815 [Candidatus Kaiserbacteria bacterium CG10_big_fil_rev_8_21_14_0_10_56_12]|uniref:DUF8173 domain-containing protein n=1 Tax=Candidatus Kaiserbacteria bacterium CG10_big_fil_rev_8_21_14_0_10_56_12 TaxID=1974611 RepID=A0A2H0U9H7_9BACT|nr:MAG: hypothetical protein COU19_02815 [Candidatus Kaiserbacteria bacterium CG10_big_fil_rev_8_21_14_0_10_56_12]
MRQLTLATVLVLLLPSTAFAAGAASFSAGHELFATSSAPGNAYTAGTSVVITAPTAGDLSVAGGSIVSAGVVGEDALLLGGSVNSRAAVKGDFRAVSGTITIEDTVGGDLVAIGYRVDDAARAGGSVLVIAGNASITNGAMGPVVIYANNVFLSGNFAGNVHVVSGGAVTLAPGTTIHGTFSYQAPEIARGLDAAVIDGGTQYTNASLIPDVGTSRALAVASLGIFLLIRILGALILAGLLAGLFPRFAGVIAEQAVSRSTRSFLLTTLLGLAALIATPIVLMIIALTFVGFGVALLLGILYALLVVLSIMYAGILLGNLCVRRFLHRTTVEWHDGVLGMLVLSLIVLVPVIGWLVAAVLTAFVAGKILSLSFYAAFPHDGREEGGV